MVQWRMEKWSGSVEDGLVEGGTVEDVEMKKGASEGEVVGDGTVSDGALESGVVNILHWRLESGEVEGKAIEGGWNSVD